MLGYSVFLIIGLAMLVAGGNWFVDGAAALARILKVRPLIIGIVVIGFGTSAPELLVSILATTDNKAELAIGNLVGSNIANIGLIMALAAIVFPLAVTNSLLLKELPLTVAITVLFSLLVIIDGRLDLVDGLLLVVAFALAFIYLLTGSKRKQDSAAEEIITESAAVAHPPKRSIAVLQVLVGLGFILGGAQLTVDNATQIAREVGLSEAVIGLTMVALGTSLPELVAAIIAALKRETELIVGNVLGSNLYNLGFTGGIVALLAGNGVTLENSLKYMSNGFMLGFTLLLVPLLWHGLKLNRYEGALCLIGYSIYIFLLF